MPPSPAPRRFAAAESAVDGADLVPDLSVRHGARRPVRDDVPVNRHRDREVRRRVALGRLDVAADRSDHQRQANAHGKRDRHSRRVDGDDQKNVGDVEHATAQECGPQAVGGGLLQVGDRAHPGRPHAPEGKRKQ